MLTKLAAITVLPMLLVGGAVMNSSVMLVQVYEDDMRIMVPVPLALAQVAVAFLPDEMKRIPVPDIDRYVPYLERFLTELEAVPDVMLVEVQDRNDHVQVFKEGDFLRVKVIERDGERVEVRLPLATVRGVVDSYDTEGKFFRTSRLVGALRAAPSGDFVHVIDGDEEVRIRMW